MSNNYNLKRLDILETFKEATFKNDTFIIANNHATRKTNNRSTMANATNVI